MTDAAQIIILFLIGCLAGFINVNAGGGSSLTLPALIFLGLESSVANGTNRIAILIQNIFAITSFKKEKVSDFKNSIILSLFTLPGAVVGALAAVRIDDLLFKRILGIVMIGIVLSIVLGKRGKQSSNTAPSQRPRWLLYASLFGIGFYGGFLQVGVGFLIMAALYHLMQTSLVRVNMHKVFIIFIYTIPALIIFISTGNVNWGLGLTLAAGNSLGAWWGARAAVKGGEKVIRIILIVAILIMAAKLLGTETLFLTR